MILRAIATQERGAKRRGIGKWRTVKSKILCLSATERSAKASQEEKLKCVVGSLNRKSEKLNIKIEFMLEVNLEEGKRLTFKFAFLLIMFS